MTGYVIRDSRGSYFGEGMYGCQQCAEQDANYLHEECHGLTALFVDKVNTDEEPGCDRGHT